MDSMLGYRNERYLYFGRAAAKLDDAVNLIPARLAALLLIAAAGITGEDAAGAFRIWRRDRRKHLSPNSGHPEAALAAILDCRFGGPHDYFGEEVWKPYIGENDRQLTTADMQRAVRVNRGAEILMVILAAAARFFCTL